MCNVMQHGMQNLCAYLVLVHLRASKTKKETKLYIKRNRTHKQAYNCYKYNYNIQAVYKCA